MTDLLTIPAREILAGTSRLTALESVGFRLDLNDHGNVRVYERGETAQGLSQTPRIDRYCVARRRA